MANKMNQRTALRTVLAALKGIDFDATTAEAATIVEAMAEKMDKQAADAAAKPKQPSVQALENKAAFEVLCECVAVGDIITCEDIQRICGVPVVTPQRARSVVTLGLNNGTFEAKRVKGRASYLRVQ